MTLENLQLFFLWCMIINVGLMLFSFIIVTLARGWVCRLHGRLYGLPPEKVASTMYKAMSFYKIVVFVFNIVPYVALRIIG